MRKLAFFLFVVMLALFAGQAHAQRCLPKMKGHTPDLRYGGWFLFSLFKE